MYVKTGLEWTPCAPPAPRRHRPDRLLRHVQLHGAKREAVNHRYARSFRLHQLVFLEQRIS